MATSYPLPEGFTELEVFAIGTILLAEALLGFLLNGLTILSFYKIKELRTPNNLLIFSLAVADTGLCINAFIAAFSSFLRYWPYGTKGCQAHGFQGFVAALSSISFCAAIAWDRYNQYCTRSKLQWSTSVSVVLSVWTFSAFWSAMPLLGWGEYDYEPLRTCCTLDYSKGDRNFISYLLPMAFFEFLIPLFIMVTAYQSMTLKFKKNGQLKIPAILAKSSPAVNAFIYGLGNESYRGGIWQFLTGQKAESIEADNKTK
ncbi:RPE-retinal G protein-coupled receptor isoform X2 [Rhinatrema bivittatum]|uniref:RPE-retinal G protein-coupled receptor isoform X2 n=1 Tax=Rhinatrema bivittatum TaxID=194408 RepID=UPI00112A2152|nr:RPE-retinal G protein-coupled receptor isoform X2 [Rhinatrema bivittatum]